MTVVSEPTCCVKVACCAAGWWAADDRLREALTAMDIRLVYLDASCVQVPASRLDELRERLGDAAVWLRVSRVRK